MNKVSPRGASLVVGMIALVWLAVACDAVERIRGSGVVKTESRDVGGFTEVALAGTGEVRVERADKDSLTVEAEDNILPLLEATVKDGRLTLTTKNRTNISPTKPIVYRITARHVDGVSISGSGKFEVVNVDAKAFAISISGSGKIDANGKTDTLDVAINGSGSTDTSNLPAAVAKVSVAGSGKVLVNARETLDVNIAGSGSIEYVGSPKVQKRIAGAGRVSARAAQ